MINIHFSLLPKWRGAAPVERALLAGDSETGVCIMDIGIELDTGDIYAQTVTRIAVDDTLSSLRGRLVAMGSDLLVETLTTGLAAPMPQTGEVSYAKKISPAELEIDWTLPATTIDRLVRLGGAWTLFRGTRLKIHEVAISSSAGVPGCIDGLVVSVVRADSNSSLCSLKVRLAKRQPLGVMVRGRPPTIDWDNDRYSEAKAQRESR